MKARSARASQASPELHGGQEVHEVSGVCMATQARWDHRFPASHGEPTV
jgi:hypothetical protein